MISISGDIHSSKNSKRIVRNQKTGQPYLVKSVQSKLDEEAIGSQLNTQKDEWERMISKVKPPYYVIFRFRRKTIRHFDYINLAQGVLDAMQVAEYFPEDDMNYVIPGFAPYVLDRENPGVDILICPFTIDITQCV